MTNNPTIDGVSREDERHAAVKTLHDIMQSVPSASLYSLAEAVLDAGYAPAVERQEPTIKRFNTSVSHGGSYEHVVLEEHRNGHVMQSNDVVKYVTAMQSTIARLEARIAELESGRGEPVAWQYRVSAGPATGWSLWHDGKGDEFRNSYQVENRPLFTAPPAPVAVVLPERKPNYDTKKHPAFLQGWNACLDAAAALNGPAK